MATFLATANTLKLAVLVAFTRPMYVKNVQWSILDAQSGDASLQLKQTETFSVW
jgi:hypothetical protein